MSTTNYLETTDLLNSGMKEKSNGPVVNLSADIMRSKNVIFSSVKLSSVQPAIICISDDSDCEELTHKRTKRLIVKQERTSVFHDAFSKVKTKPKGEAGRWGR